MSHLPWNILLVEDDEDDYILVKILLGQVLEPGFQLHWARDYDQALDALRPELDVLLVDYNLGTQTGLELVQEAVRRGCKAPMILMTGHGNYKLDLAAMHAGVSDYLQKAGLNGQALERSIRYAIERQQAAEKLRQAHDELEARVIERTGELSLANSRLAQANHELAIVNEFLAAANQDLEVVNQALINEVHERERAQAAADTERQRLFGLMENLPALVSLIAPDYTLRFANGRCREQFGEANGEVCYRLFHQREAPCEGCPIPGNPYRPYPYEWETTLPNGSSLHLYAYPFMDADGSPLTIEMGIDISRRKRVEAELERYNQELLAVTEAERTQRHLAEGLVEATTALSYSLNVDEVLDLVLEQTHRVIPCCAVGIILLEDGMGHVARRRGFENIPQALPILESRFPFTDIPLFQRMNATGEPVLLADTRDEPEWIEVPGLEWVRSYAAAPLKVGGQLYGFLNILSEQSGQFYPDITERLRAFAAHAAVAIHNAHVYKDLENALSHEQAMRTRLIASEKLAAMGRMTASVAHELNNPLQTIKNCLFLIRDETPPRSSSHEYLDMASSETQRLSNLVTQLRELYRPRIALGVKALEVHALVDQVYELLDTQLDNSRVRWISCLGDEPVWINGSPDSLKQVLINICLNSIEAMQPAGGAINISLEGAQAEAEAQESTLVGITFTDSGPGIPPENMARLFEPFFTTKSSGLGLGLSICYEIADRHGGRLSVESQLGQGAAFTLWLPPAAPPAA